MLCRSRGRLKKEEQGLYVGDNVIITALSDSEGVIEKIIPRRSLLLRPPLANVEQIVIVCTMQEPPLSLQLIDRLLVLAESRQIRAVICVNKSDLTHGDIMKFQEIYRQIGYPVIITSAKTGCGIDELSRQLCGRISVFAGQSGTGKSSLINCLQQEIKLKIGSISAKGKVGRHTTRQVRLISLECGGFAADTPGFSRVDISEIKSNELERFFPEFFPYLQECRFDSCRHGDEPGCAVISAVRQEKISATRYDNYLSFLRQIERQERRLK